MKTTVFIRTKLHFFLLILIPASVLFYASCHKDDDEPTPTCDDGIQNQGETGVDCGGPCAACPTALCDGNGQNQFMPLANGNYWKYEDQGVSSANYSLTVSGTQTINSNTYHVVEFCNLPPSCSPSLIYYIRIAGNGNVYTYNISDSTEYLLIPANPTMNQTWPFPVDNGIGQRKVMSINESVTTYDCTYSDCLTIQEYTTSSAPWMRYKYKKGVGMVFQSAGVNYRLVEITLH